MSKYKPEQFRPMGDHLMLKVDDLPEKMGEILYRPGGAYSNDDIKCWSTVISVGPGKWSNKGVRIPLGVKPGERVVVIRVHEKVETQTAFQELFGKGYLVLQPKDIIVVQDDEEEVRDEEGHQQAAPTG